MRTKSGLVFLVLITNFSAALIEQGFFSSGSLLIVLSSCKQKTNKKQKRKCSHVLPFVAISSTSSRTTQVKLRYREQGTATLVASSYLRTLLPFLHKIAALKHNLCSPNLSNRTTQAKLRYREQGTATLVVSYYLRTLLPFLHKIAALKHNS